MNRGALAATNTATNSEGPSHSFDFLNRRRTCLLARWSEYPARITYDVQGMGQTAPRNLAGRLPLPLGKLLRRPARCGMGSEYRNRLGQRTPARPSPHVGHRTSIGPLVLSGVQRSPRALAQGAGRDRVWRTADDHHAGVRSSASPSHRISIYFSYILPCRFNSFTRSLKVSTLPILEGKRLASYVLSRASLTL